MERLLRDHPRATFIAFTRRGANLLDALGISALFRRKRELATVDGDIKSLHSNYDSSHKLLPKGKRQPQQVK
eukprot:4592943-Karenia_brevis.AAC.1